MMDYTVWWILFPSINNFTLKLVSRSDGGCNFMATGHQYHLHEDSMKIHFLKARLPALQAEQDNFLPAE